MSDVDTYRGWKRRGRHVRQGEQGLRIVRPVGRNGDDDRPDPAEVPGHDHNGGDGDEAPRVRFRFAARWDISQTDPDDLDQWAADDACPSCGVDLEQPCSNGCVCLACAAQAGHTNAEPADVAWNRLQEQVVQTGYRFGWPATDADLHGAKVRVDHQAATVHVHMFAAADPTAIADLAAALGAILTRHRDHPDPDPDPDPDSAAELAAVEAA